MTPKQIDFGRRHPQYNDKITQKANWSHDELEWIRNWKLEYSGTMQVHRCRLAILDNPEARDIFHARHVLDNARLRDGFNKLTHQDKTATSRAERLQVAEQELKRMCCTDTEKDEVIWREKMKQMIGFDWSFVPIVDESGVHSHK